LIKQKPNPKLAAIVIGLMMIFILIITSIPQKELLSPAKTGLAGDAPGTSDLIKYSKQDYQGMKIGEYQTNYQTINAFTKGKYEAGEEFTRAFRTDPETFVKNINLHFEFLEKYERLDTAKKEEVLNEDYEGTKGSEFLDNALIIKNNVDQLVASGIIVEGERQRYGVNPENKVNSVILWSGNPGDLIVYQEEVHHARFAFDKEYKRRVIDAYSNLPQEERTELAKVMQKYYPHLNPTEERYANEAYARLFYTSVDLPDNIPEDMRETYFIPIQNLQEKADIPGENDAQFKLSQYYFDYAMKLKEHGVESDEARNVMLLGSYYVDKAVKEGNQDAVLFLEHMSSVRNLIENEKAQKLFDSYEKAEKKDLSREERFELVDKIELNNILEEVLAMEDEEEQKAADFAAAERSLDRAIEEMLPKRPDEENQVTQVIGQVEDNKLNDKRQTIEITNGGSPIVIEKIDRDKWVSGDKIYSHDELIAELSKFGGGVNILFTTDSTQPLDSGTELTSFRLGTGISVADLSDIAAVSDSELFEVALVDIATGDLLIDQATNDIVTGVVPREVFLDQLSILFPERGSNYDVFENYMTGTNNQVDIPELNLRIVGTTSLDEAKRRGIIPQESTLQYLNPFLTQIDFQDGMFRNQFTASNQYGTFGTYTTGLFGDNIMNFQGIDNQEVQVPIRFTGFGDTIKIEDVQFGIKEGDRLSLNFFPGIGDGMWYLNPYSSSVTDTAFQNAFASGDFSGLTSIALGPMPEQRSEPFVPILERAQEQARQSIVQLPQSQEDIRIKTYDGVYNLVNPEEAPEGLIPSGENIEDYEILDIGRNKQDGSIVYLAIKKSDQRDYRNKAEGVISIFTNGKDSTIPIHNQRAVVEVPTTIDEEATRPSPTEPSPTPADIAFVEWQKAEGETKNPFMTGLKVGLPETLEHGMNYRDKEKWPSSINIESVTQAHDHIIIKYKESGSIEYYVKKGERGEYIYEMSQTPEEKAVRELKERAEELVIAQDEERRLRRAEEYVATDAESTATGEGEDKAPDGEADGLDEIPVYHTKKYWAIRGKKFYNKGSATNPDWHYVKKGWFGWNDPAATKYDANLLNNALLEKTQSELENLKKQVKAAADALRAEEDNDKAKQAAKILNKAEKAAGAKNKELKKLKDNLGIVDEKPQTLVESVPPEEYRRRLLGLDENEEATQPQESIEEAPAEEIEKALAKGDDAALIALFAETEAATPEERSKANEERIQSITQNPNFKKLPKERQKAVLTLIAGDAIEKNNYELAALAFSKAGHYREAGEAWAEIDSVKAAQSYRKAITSLERDENNRIKDQDALSMISDIKSAIDTLIKTETDEKKQAQLKKELKIVENVEYLNTPPRLFGWPGFNKWHSKLAKWSSYLEGYSGASFFYDADENWIYDSLDESMQNIVSGIPGWSSELCKSDALDGIGAANGFAFSQSVSGASAHIEAERITVTNFTNPEQTTDKHYYKASFEVNPGTASVGCDLVFRAYLKGQGRETLGEDIYELERGSPQVSYSGSNMIVKQTNKMYTHACLNFEEIKPRSGGSCLIGIEEGDELCSVIAQGMEQDFNVKFGVKGLGGTAQGFFG